MTIVFNYTNCKVHVKYLKQVNNSNNWYYVRRIPDDLHHHYSKKDKRIVLSTKTSNKVEASRKAIQINQKIESEWKVLRSGTRELTSYEAALEYLNKFGLNESSHRSSETHIFDAFQDELESTFTEKRKKELHDSYTADQAEFMEHHYRDALNDIQKTAVDIATGKFVWTASMILEEHFKRKEWASNRKQRNNYEPAFQALYDLLGDRRPSEYSKLDVDDLIKYLRNKGLKTGTIKKRLSSIRSAFTHVTELHDLREDQLHPFRKFHIPNLNEDAKVRPDFTPTQLSTLRSNVKGATDEIHGLIAVLMETGLRVKEACGIMKSDVSEIGDITFVRIHQNNLRRLKTKSSQRIVPLVGVAKDYALSITGEWLFPRYVDLEKQTVKNESASMIVNKRLKRMLGDDAPTAHSFRHTINTRLRDIGCPKDIRDELGGWAKSISDNYGSPTDISKKNEYLLASLEWKGQTK